jgi:Uma2 family endonuclease
MEADAAGLLAGGFVCAEPLDREDWTKNHRRPDVVVFMNGTTAQNRDTFWLGGPDFAVEIVSEADASRDKLEFYGRVGVRELLIVDRNPWKLELCRLHGKQLRHSGECVQGSGAGLLTSDVVPLSFSLTDARPRPLIDVIHRDSVQRWTA